MIRLVWYFVLALLFVCSIFAQEVETPDRRMGPVQDVSDSFERPSAGPPVGSIHATLSSADASP